MKTDVFFLFTFTLLKCKAGFPPMLTSVAHISRSYNNIDDILYSTALQSWQICRSSFYKMKSLLAGNQQNLNLVWLLFNSLKRAVLTNCFDTVRRYCDIKPHFSILQGIPRDAVRHPNGVRLAASASRWAASAASTHVAIAHAFASKEQQLPTSARHWVAKVGVKTMTKNGQKLVQKFNHLTLQSYHRRSTIIFAFTDLFVIAFTIAYFTLKSGIRK